MCVQNIISTVQEQGGFGELGFTLLAILYIFQTIGSVMGPALVTKVGIKCSLVIGAMMMSFVVLAQVIPAWRVTQLHEDPGEHG